MASKTYCVNLFSQVYVDNLGYLHPCCLFDSDAWEPPAQHHISRTSPEDFLAGEFMQSLRDLATKGTSVPGCSACYSQESVGTKSLRQYDNEFASWKVRDPKQTSLTSLDLRGGNLCNFACQTCSPYASSKLDSLWREHGSENFSSTDRSMDLRISDEEEKQWLTKPQTLDNLVKLGQSLKGLSLAGGEPMLNPVLISLLKFLRPRQKSLRLEVISNGSIVTDEIIELLENFDTLFRFSMDGIGKTCEYIRFPCKFTELEKNLDRLLNSKIKVVIVSTVSVFNLLNLKEQYLWLREKARAHKKDIYFLLSNIVHSPEHMDVLHMDSNTRVKAISLLQEVSELQKDKVPFGIETGGSEQQLINYLKSDTGNPGKIQNGWKYVEYYDRIRGNSWKTVAPWMLSTLSPAEKKQI